MKEKPYIIIVGHVGAGMTAIGMSLAERFSIVELRDISAPQPILLEAPMQFPEIINPFNSVPINRNSNFTPKKKKRKK